MDFQRIPVRPEKPREQLPTKTARSGLTEEQQAEALRYMRKICIAQQKRKK